MSDVSDTVAGIRQVLSEFARLHVDAGAIGADVDLFASGMTSHASVDVMLALEETFGIEFPDELLRKSTFESVNAIRDALATLGIAA